MNLPNKLSVARIIAVPIMVTLYYLPIPLAPLWSTGVFLLAAFTDFLDGYIARKYNMITDLGKLLDPIADKLLVVFALFIITQQQLLPPLVSVAACGIIVARELLIGIVRQIAASKGRIIQANAFGKLKTIFQDISIPLMLLVPLFDLPIFKLADYNTLLVFRYMIFGLFGVALLFTLLSLVIYLIQNRGVFKESD